MKPKKTNFFNIVWKIITILLIILIVYWFIELIFGGSPELSQFNFALIILMIGFLIKIYREIGEMNVGIKHSFISIKEDICLIKGKLKK